MKRDHDEEFEQDQGLNQEGFEIINTQENNDSNDLNPSEDSASNQADHLNSTTDGNIAKRQKRNDDEEVRLLIPSKVSSFYSILMFHNHDFINSFFNMYIHSLLVQ